MHVAPFPQGGRSPSGFHPGRTLAARQHTGLFRSRADARFGGIGSSAARGGFSLVEVTLALGIIAFAFVALLGMLPAGLSNFRQSIDTVNEATIVQDLNSMVQVTDWSKVDDLDYSKSGEVYYYSEEGRLTDTKTKPVSGLPVGKSRLYGAKLLIQPFYRPATSQSDLAKPARRVLVVIANITQPPILEEFDRVTSATAVTSIKKGVPVRVRSFLVTQMETSI